MNNGGSAFTDYENVNQFLVSLNGILQAPTDSFTVSGSTLTFASNLATGDVIDFVIVLGNTLDIGTPSDATVTQAKTNFVSTSSSAGLQIKGDNTTGGTLQLNCEQNSHGIKLRSPAHSAGQSYTLTFPTGNVTADRFLKVASVSGSGATGVGQLSFAEAGGGGKILQVIEDTLDAEFESSSTSFVDTGLSVNITPSATSSKILIIGNACGDTKGNRYIYASLFRDSTNLATGTGADGFGIIYTADGERLYGSLPMMKLDSPNTTSQVTYQLRARTNSGGFRITQHNQTSSIIVMEVGA